MKSTLYAALAAAATVSHVAAHATFQDLWVDGDVTSDDIICNAGTSPAAGKCVVRAGSTVTVEMHQQPGDRSCASEAIGGAHYGPVQVYLAAVSDASSADAGAAGSSASWFKVFADTWAANPAGSSGDDDFWGTKDLNACCGRLDAVIPADLAPGDYLLRAEALALHTAASAGGAQFYVTCFQLTVESDSGGSAVPEGVAFPGAYAASDPGILVDIHAPMTTYVAPGPTVYAGGSTKSAGAACAGCESTCAAGASSTLASAGTSTSAATSVQTTVVETPTTLTTSTAQATSTSTAGCQVSLYGQCGGSGFTGCTTCGTGTCNKLNDYYSQCTN
ncbi:carbohydrate-binding module family 1 protein [Biscogniauxia mediterranea]|nr:carbohydrate-binding module family 1 protein [Biscogniauxia mediterranea]